MWRQSRRVQKSSGFCYDPASGGVFTLSSFRGAFMKNQHVESLEARRLLSADLTNRIDANGQPITNTFPSTFYSSSFAAKINFQPSSVSNSKLPTGYKS